MAFNYRKLFIDLVNVNVTEFCTPFCDPSMNLTCPIRCLPICNSTCQRSLLSQIPPLPPPPPPPPPFPTISDDQSGKHSTNLSSSLTLTIGILSTAFFVFCSYTFFKFYTGWYRSRQQRSQPQPQPQPQPEQTHDHDDFLDEDHGPVLDHPIWYIRTVGLQPSVISAITIFKYKKGEGLVEGTECSVCLSEFEENETLRLLPKCNHAFHIPCIDTWLRSHTNCPMCRAGIVAGAVRSSSPEQIVDNSGLVEETHEGISEIDNELGRERGDEAFELRIGIDEEGEPGIESDIQINEIPKAGVGNSDQIEVDEFQPMRRSVSLDILSASMISAAIANVYPVESDENSYTQLVKVNQSDMGIVPKRIGVNQSLLRLVGSSSIARSLQKGPVSMKRSFSCSGKVLLSRHNRSRSSILPS